MKRIQMEPVPFLSGLLPPASFKYDLLRTIAESEFFQMMMAPPFPDNLALRSYFHDVIVFKCDARYLRGIDAIRDHSEIGVFRSLLDVVMKTRWSRIPAEVRGQRPDNISVPVLFYDGGPIADIVAVCNAFK